MGGNSKSERWGRRRGRLRKPRPEAKMLILAAMLILANLGAKVMGQNMADQV